jgi:hypothetical protein
MTDPNLLEYTLGIPLPAIQSMSGTATNMQARRGRQKAAAASGRPMILLETLD